MGNLLKHQHHMHTYFMLYLLNVRNYEKKVLFTNVHRFRQRLKIYQFYFVPIGKLSRNMFPYKKHSEFHSLKTSNYY